ncbi:MAG: winged helix-turn-helix transcriptional regulator [Methanobacterium sp.]|uniref:ArsR/SmtB family transcription factor n=1 Tax=Methanobacterium sp. TaxID=2164 RepID=UPI003D64D0E2|nr:winged helix-turn-helix transcriptional regulator [Methanobacterium sp.]
MKRMLWWLIAGTKGGENRARIISTLHKRPYNANQLAKTLEMDYKTVRHHITILKDNNIIVSSGEKYGNMYFLSTQMEDNYGLFKHIWQEISEN